MVTEEKPIIRITAMNGKRWNIQPKHLRLSLIHIFIGFSIAFIGVMIAYTSIDNDETIAVVVLFIVSALVVFVYECIVSKKMNVIKQCIPSILLGDVYKRQDRRSK